MPHIYYLTFPGKVTHQPIIYGLIKEYDIKVNILRGGIEADKGGYLVLEFAGEDTALERGIEFLKNMQIGVTRNASRIHFNAEDCVQCGACTAVCFGDALILDTDKTLVFDIEACIFCRMCVTSCPLKLFSFN
jgi:L-aspartate semialdehyde sulfurtransferase ferredoxin